jgi:hypothetical protein
MRRHHFAAALALAAIVPAGAGCSGSPTRADRLVDHSVDHSVGGVPPTGRFVVISNGWTDQRVAGAHVTGADVDATTDGAGQIGLPSVTGCVTLAVNAPGYLERRTCADHSITLWPVADEAEATATREAVFDGSGHLYGPNDVPWVLTGELLQRSDLRGVWLEAAGALRKLGFTIPTGGDSSEEFIVSVAQTPPSCNHPWFTWSFAAAGFCWDRTPEYFTFGVTIDPARVSEEAVALRAMVYGLSFHPHSAPGLLNRTAPANELSEFEKRTLRMMYLRSAERITWPDYGGAQ